MKRTDRTTSRQRWFITERPITSRDADAFSHDTLAKVLVDSVHQAVEDFKDEPGAATIGLIGGFGTGKTSVVNLASKRLRSDLDINVVHVSADKHSGHARSRNIVHSIAGELVDRKLLEDHDVNEHLQWLRSSVSLAAPAPEEMRLAKMVSDPKGQTLKDFWATLLLAAVFFVLTLVGALFVGGGVGTVLSSVGSLAFVGSFLTVAYKHVVGSLFEIPKRSTNRARADAADDVQQVFANLINKYVEENNDKPLVIFVDDIDRLGTADVLDAMRTIKSLQAVPRRKEPTFVVSCDDEVILAALKDQAHTDDQAEAIDHTAGIASNNRDETARAYLDKFFSVRVPMPPHVRDDMPTFVHKLVPADHPLRASEHIGDPEVVEAALLVLARGDVDSPRHLVHRVNGFLTAYRIAADRESATSGQRLHPGDATGRPILLARLSVIARDFSWFHRYLLRDEALLGAADRLARHDELTPTDEELLTSYRLAIHESPEEVDDEGELGTGVLRWNPAYDDLRTYLVSTYLSVEKSDESIVPLLYLAEPEGGRVFGNAKVGALMTAVRNGDVSRVVESLDQLPTEHGKVTADQIREAVTAATRAELPAALTGAVASLPILNEFAEPVAVSIAERLPNIPASTLSEQAYHDLLHALPETHHSGVLQSFATIEPDTAEDARNERALSVAAYLAGSPNARHLPGMICEHLDRLPDHAGWTESHDWVDVALRLDDAVHADLLADHLIPSVFRLAKADPSVDFDDTAQGLLRLVENLDSKRRSALGPVLRVIVPQSEGAAQLLVAAYELIGSLTHVDDALRVAKAISFDLEDAVSAKAVELLGMSVPAWKDAVFKKKEEDEEDRYCADAIAADVSSLISPEPGHLTSSTLSSYAPDFATSQHAFSRLLEVSITAVEEVAESSPVDDELLSIVRSFLTAKVDDPDAVEQGNAVPRVLAPLAATGDLTPKAKSLLTVVEHLGRSKDHRSMLEPEAAKWTQSLRAAENPYLKHPQIAAFSALDAVAPKTAGSEVDSVLASLQQWLQNASDQGHLRALASLPWGDQLKPALDLVANNVDDFASYDEVLPILRRAHEREVEIPADLINRFVKFVESDPLQQIPQARTVWSAFSPIQQSRMLFAGLAGSDTGTELIGSAHPATFTQLLVRAALNDRVSDLVAVAELDDRSEEILDAVRKLVDENVAIGKDDFVSLIDTLDDSDVATVLVERVPEASGEARTALKLLSLDPPVC